MGLGSRTILSGSGFGGICIRDLGGGPRIYLFPQHRGLNDFSMGLSCIAPEICWGSSC